MKLHIIVIGVLLSASLAVDHCRAQSNIDASQKWSWGENVGWMNWRDANGGVDGVRVSPDYLRGWIWCENVGWINVGDGSPNFGVNIDENGDMYGFGWAENIGWVNFDTRTTLGPSSQQAMFDDGPDKRFSGYAWGENIGWINLDDSMHFVALDPATAIVSHPPESSTPVKLVSAHPNPFNPKTKLNFTITSTARVHLVIFDVLGRRVRILIDMEMSPGLHHHYWDGYTDEGRSAPSGIYFVRLQAGEAVSELRVALIK